MFLTMAVAAAILTLPPIRRWQVQRQPGIDEQQFFLAVHGELRGGASLRHAIGAAAQAQPGEIAEDIHRAAGGHQSMAAVCAALRQLPQMGRTAAMATRVAIESGGRAAEVFHRLADRARVNADLERQRRTLTAQARLSAAVVGSLPLLWLVFGGWSRLQVLIRHGGGLVAAAGVGMEALGMALVWRLAAS